MPTIPDNQLPEPQHRIFTSDRPVVDTSVADLITGLGKTALQAGQIHARHKTNEAAEQQIDQFIEGREAQAELNEIPPETAEFFEDAEVGDTSKEVVAFRERVAVLQDAAKAGDISTTELKIRIRKDMRQAIRENPFFAPEIEDAANGAMGRYSEILDYYEQQDATAADNAKWAERQILAEAPKLGLDIRRAMHPDPTVRSRFWRDYTARWDIKSQLAVAEGEEALRTLTKNQTADGQQSMAPRVVQANMVDLQANLTTALGIPLSDPDSFREWFDNTPADRRASLQAGLENEKGRYIAAFNSRFPLLSDTERSGIVRPYIQQIETTQKLLSGELTADALDFQNAITSSRVVAALQSTPEGRLFTVIGTQFPGASGEVLMRIANISESVLSTALEADPYTSLSDDNRRNLQTFHSDFMGPAMTEQLKGTTPERQEAAAGVVRSFVSSTNALRFSQQLQPEELRGFYHTASNPLIADFMADQDAGNPAEKAMMSTNFASGTHTYINRLRDSYRPIMAQNPDLMIDASQPDGMIRYIFKPETKPSVTQGAAAELLNANHAVHFNTMIKALAHLEGGRTAADYVQARSFLIDLLNRQPPGGDGTVKVTVDDNGDFQFGEPLVGDVPEGGRVDPTTALRDFFSKQLEGASPAATARPRGRQ